MKAKHWATSLFIFAGLCFLHQFHELTRFFGLFSVISDSEGRVLAAVFFTGALILYYLPEDEGVKGE